VVGRVPRFAVMLAALPVLHHYSFFVICRLLLTTIRRFSIIISLYFRVFLAQFIVFLFLTFLRLSSWRRPATCIGCITFRAVSVRFTHRCRRWIQNLPVKFSTDRLRVLLPRNARHSKYISRQRKKEHRQFVR